MAARLSHRDIGTLLGFLQGTYASRDLDGFAGEATRCLVRVVPADRFSYSEWHRRRGPARTFVEPGGVVLGGALGDAYKRYGHESPLLSYYRRVRRLEVRTFSDLMTTTQYHRSRLYNEYYRHVGVEHQIVVPLTLTASSTTGEVAFAISRRRPDFSERDRLMLELLQPHLLQAYANAAAVERMQSRALLLTQAVEGSDQGVIFLGEDGVTPPFITEGGRRRLEAYFGVSGRLRPQQQLPETLARWVKCQEQALAGDNGVPAPRRPLVVERDGKRLTVRLVNGDEQRMLVLEERCLGVEPSMLSSLGLTRRECEVLAWVAKGKSNDEVGVILGMRSATVGKHLEHIYRKLGVESRTAAVAQALAAAGASP